MGINANAVVATAFGLSGLLAGVAGVLWLAQRGSVDPLMGFLPVLKAFIAVVEKRSYSRTSGAIS